MRTAPRRHYENLFQWSFSLDILIMCVVITTTNQWLWRFVASRTTPFMITSLR
ncbi:uncharacterized protein GLRG_11465 [Colletotrichum graminicola M1.001]|uniref:Uncharacterized protein n=1 Tax=Colletotrichum graminicola (strain M1.001 / M2 / FGSC 10212) TaxID=645133 RepID=E3QZN2_COLGM|nr:uncharacterized protein GLRG_11465 [Colletotrichum graminicola M1.001]EFQ36320.1 hypothetical protein GLRG_11465 [Colletotrichum graminicola M1.001]